MTGSRRERDVGGWTSAFRDRRRGDGSAARTDRYGGVRAVSERGGVLLGDRWCSQTGRRINCVGPTRGLGFRSRRRTAVSPDRSGERCVASSRRAMRVHSRGSVACLRTCQRTSARPGVVVTASGRSAAVAECLTPDLRCSPRSRFSTSATRPTVLRASHAASRPVRTRFLQAQGRLRRATPRRSTTV